jgi:hypothetical protein
MKTLLALLLAVPLLCAAQAEAPVARPRVNVGDYWAYVVIDLSNNSIIARRDIRVTFANDEIIHTVTTLAEGDKPHDVTFSADWNQISSVNGAVFYPRNGFFRFPLQVGATYPAVYEFKMPRHGALHLKHDRSVKVKGWETIEVPAGTFRALRIEVDGTFQRLDTSVSGKARNVIWYAPEVKRWVKWTYEDETFRGRGNWEGFELIEYRLR